MNSSVLNFMVQMSHVYMTARKQLSIFSHGYLLLTIGRFPNTEPKRVEEVFSSTIPRADKLLMLT